MTPIQTLIKTQKLVTSIYACKATTEGMDELLEGWINEVFPGMDEEGKLRRKLKIRFTKCGSGFILKTFLEWVTSLDVTDEDENKMLNLLNEWLCKK